ncbi:hypothetical protein [Frankia sp. EI5c]|uniref:hypothetical protein n=1 Tax=Frankia sp. EI5c TaxID=683316 RepID=UPI0008250789|nr:hypothetical protein [Frankia sp. EI5c]
MASSAGGLSWREIADLQSGVISERDAIGTGLTRADIRAQLAAGTWRQPARGVLLTTAGPPTWAQRSWVAVLAGGPGAVLGGATAAALDGLAGHDDPVVTVLVPPERRYAPMAGATFRRTARLSPAEVHGTRLPPRTVPARSVIDMAEWSDDRDTARAVIVDAVSQGFVTIDALRRALAARGPITRRTLIGDTVDDLTRRTPRMLERLYRQIEISAALPAGRPLAADSPERPTGRLDVWYGSRRLLVRVGQPGSRRAARPTGRRILDIPTEQLWQAPREVAALVAAALHDHRPHDHPPHEGPPLDGKPLHEHHEAVGEEAVEGDQGVAERSGLP